MQCVGRPCEASRPPSWPPPCWKVLTSFLGPAKAPPFSTLALGFPGGLCKTCSSPTSLHIATVLWDLAGDSDARPAEGKHQTACPGPAPRSQLVPVHPACQPLPPQSSPWPPPALRWGLGPPQMRSFPGRPSVPPSLCSLSEAGVHLPAGPMHPPHLSSIVRTTWSLCTFSLCPSPSGPELPLLRSKPCATLASRVAVNVAISH